MSINAGFLLPTPAQPLRFQITSKHKALPNFLSARIGKAIPQRVIDVIEQFEPGVHRYWPLDITFKDGSKSKPYWMLNITQQLDTISREHSTVGEIKYSSGMSSIGFRDDLPEKRLVCLKEKIGTHHLWCEYRFDLHATFITDELAEAFREIGVEGLDFDFHAEEI